ncbi:MAG TPA: hypothetical protein VF884_10605 [Nitrososphaeraceae archaeon]
MHRRSEALFIGGSLLVAALLFPAMALANGSSIQDTVKARTQLLAAKIGSDADKNLGQIQNSPKTNTTETEPLSSDPFISKDTSQKMTPANLSLGLSKHRENNEKGSSSQETNLLCNENKICSDLKKPSETKGSSEKANNIRFELPIDIPFP